MTKEALRLALEALEGVLDDSPKVLDASISGGLYEVVQCRDAITAIKDALEAKDEPWTPDDMAYRPDGLPQQTWVGLTPEEIDEIIETAIDSMDALLQTMDKLKEKNGNA